ncbi:MAG: peptidase M50 [Firmicutes bacterium]|nr:peptidase M50 [Bacillota bacterium]
MQILRIGGIRIVLNPFFILLMLILGATGYLPHGLILFGIVFVHELAHTVVAFAYKMPITSIELLPIGGVARSEGYYTPDPFAEAMIALAGPLTNGFLCLLAMAAAPYGVIPQVWYNLFIRANCFIGLSNLIPALPLDGGRIFRGCLALKLGYRRATQLISAAGRVLGIFLGATAGAGIYFGYRCTSLLVLAFFIFIGAGREQRTAGYVFMRYLLRKQEELKSTGILPTEQLVAHGDVSVGDIVGHFVPKKYHVILVVDDQGRVAGFTTEIEIVNSFFEQGIDTPLYTIMIDTGK